jgi:hypothetical protein
MSARRGGRFPRLTILIDENSLVDVSTSLTSGDPETGLSTLVRTAASLSNGPIGPTDAAS